jgi:hypothetical protein
VSDLERIEVKIDRLDDKVDTLIANEAKNTEAISWIKGHLNMTTLIAISALGWLAVQFLT